MASKSKLKVSFIAQQISALDFLHEVFSSSQFLVTESVCTPLEMLAYVFSKVQEISSSTECMASPKISAAICGSTVLSHWETSEGGCG